MQARNTLGATGRRPDPDFGSRVSLPITPAPLTPWNKTVSPHRRFAMRSASLRNHQWRVGACDGDFAAVQANPRLTIGTTIVDY